MRFSDFHPAPVFYCEKSLDFMLAVVYSRDGVLGLLESAYSDCPRYFHDP
jgi:hypothetical protein